MAVLDTVRPTTTHETTAPWLAEHERFLAHNAASIEAFRATQGAAFAAERAAWAEAGEFDRAERAGAVLFFDESDDDSALPSEAAPAFFLP